mgnify:CR=1 FL=1
MKQSSPTKIELDELLYLYQNQKFDEAERLAVSLSRRFPKHPFPWTVHGIVLQQTGRVIDSLASMQKSVQLAPKDAGAHSNLGNTFKALGRLDKAEASYNQAIALKRDFAEAHSNLGVTLQEMGRFDEAEVSHTQAIALKPDYAEAYSNLGVTLHELGRLTQAEEKYLQAIANEDPELHKEIKKYHLTFDDIIAKFPPDILRGLLNAVELDQLSVAVKGVDQERIDELIEMLPQKKLPRKG